ncbi:MAG: FprA family A-type flavoprotein [Bacteroidales bacterium]|nr:FprA family A-type flavoprotein [Bacteroidales bacterium]
MHNIQKISNDLIYVGVSDRRLALFENVYPVPQGVSYNSYVLLDEKTALLDTADASVANQFFENLQAALGGRSLDYLIVNHMEPDHAALIPQLVAMYPEVEIIATAKAGQMMEQFFGRPMGRLTSVKEGDSLSLGRHQLTFTLAPMVHWPEVMMTYDSTDRVLFSADAFGTFGALGGNLYADEVDFEHQWLDEARRYYANIVGKYGVQVQNVLKKASALELKMVCPLHGPVWRQRIDWIVGKYDTWSRYEAEEQAVVVVYGSIYGHTESAAMRLATMLAERGVKDIKAYDASHTHVSTLVAECFRASHIVLASSTYNNGIFPPIETLLADLKAHAWQRRKVALIENGSWAPQSGKLMRAELEQMKDITLLGEMVSLKSALAPQQEAELETLAKAIVESLGK